MPLELKGDRSFTVKGLTLAAKEWGEEGMPPVIAVHGWLDNSASFDAIASNLNDIHLLAVDCAGHAQSDYRSADAGYNIWQDALEIVEIAEQMNWEKFSLIGHSRGAMICNIIAGAFPDKVSHVALIDGYMPAPVLAEHAPEQLALSYKQHKQFLQNKPTSFASYDEAVAGRKSGFLAINEEAARALAARGVAQNEDGFYWHNDQRLKGASEMKFTDEHIKGFLQAITAPVLLICGKKGFVINRKDEANALHWFKNLTQIELDGGHHLHMEESSQAAAERIQAFFAD